MGGISARRRRGVRVGKAVEAGFGIFEGRAIKKSKDAEADQLRRAATLRQAAGTQDAYEQRKIGERVESDAIAAMAAGGGMTDIEQLADIRSTTDYNVLSTLFASKNEAQQQRYAARIRNHEGRMAKRLSMVKGITTIISEAGKAIAGAGAGAGAGADKALAGAG